MTTSVALQKAFVPVLQDGLVVTLQKAFVPVLQDGLVVTLQKAFVPVLVSAGSTRRRQAMLGSF